MGISSPAYTVLKSKLPIADYFYKEYFKGANFISRLNTLIYGIRDGKQIHYSDFKTLKLPYPTLPEQQKIADFLTSIDKVIQSKQLQISQALEWKKGLMLKMFV
jgi:type I restriction enzyme S subunit